MFIHLKKDLDITEVDWITCQEPPEKEQSKRPLTDYGVQRQLAAVRTDLDSFSEAEAYALMTSGYLMTEQALDEKGVLGFNIERSDSGSESWKLLEIKQLMQEPGEDTPLIRQLRVANARVFKVWYPLPGWDFGGPSSNFHDGAGRRHKGAIMDWARVLAYVTGTVDQELLARNEYLAAENRVLKAQLNGRLIANRIQEEAFGTATSASRDATISH
jgi:hypothetical protein